MKLKTFSVIAAAVLAGGCWSAAAGEISMRLAVSRAERKAVEDFKIAYEKVTGQKFEASPYKLYVGKAASRAKWFKTPENMKPEEWCIESKDNEFVITGDVAGTTWGIYEFIEKYLNYHYLAQDTDYFVKNPAWKLPAVKERFKPAIRVRDSWLSWPQMTNGAYSLHRKINWGNGYSELCPKFGSPQRTHTIPHYAKKFPNDAPFVNGSRQHICWSNPRSIELTLQTLREFIKADRAKGEPYPLIYDISQEDGGAGYCTCKNCRKIIDAEESVSGLLLNFLNPIAEAIEKEYPDIYIQTLAYQYTQKPPKTIKAHPKIIVQSCNSNIIAPLVPDRPNGEVMRKWSRHASLLAIWSYWRTYEGDECWPYIRDRKMLQQELKFCRDINVFRYFAENENNIERSFYMFQYYLFSKLTVDPDLDMQKTTETFMKGYYGAAAEPMTKYLEYIEKRQSARPWATGILHMKFFHDEEFYVTANKYLDEAEKLVKDDPKSLLHVRNERMVVDSSLLRSQDKLGHLIKDKEALIKRWRSNKTAYLNQKIVRWHPKYTKKARFAQMDVHETIYRAMPFAIPEQFKGKEITDMHWMDFNPWGNYKNNVTDDPEAASGRTFGLSRTFNAADHKQVMHVLPLTYGMYDSTAPLAKRRLMDSQFEAKDIPQDEKYHWYCLGKYVLTPNLRFHIHWSWTICAWFRKAITGILQDNPREVWVSLKITGPAYVKGSTKPDGVWLERIIVVNDKP